MHREVCTGIGAEVLQQIYLLYQYNMTIYSVFVLSMYWYGYLHL